MLPDESGINNNIHNNVNVFPQNSALEWGKPPKPKPKPSARSSIAVVAAAAFALVLVHLHL